MPQALSRRARSAAACLCCSACLLTGSTARAATESAAPAVEASSSPAVATPPANTGAASASTAGTAGKTAPSPVVPVPPSELYGVLYRDVELAHLFPDSKTFADMIPNDTPSHIVADYTQRKSQRGFELKQFVDAHFTLPARETKRYVSDPNQSVTAHIDTLWNVLRRDPDKSASQWSSLLPLPYPYIVPGDRFDEIYYWDSFFIMLGLEASGRADLLDDELNNFSTLVDRYGHIPNGNRTYYLSRSQPPFFAQMVRLTAGRDGDAVYLHYLPELLAEYRYWMDGEAHVARGGAYRHLVKLQDGTLLNRYWDARDTPRDESYREDVVTARQTPQRDAADLWRNLRAGGETGWDFSSRWFADGKTLGTVEVTSLVPVDLNSLLTDLERTIAHAYRLKGDAAQAERFEKRASARAAAIRRVLWDPQLRAFGDYDFDAGRLTHRLSAATVYPLYFGIADKAQAAAVASTVRARLLRAGGLATTTVQSGQQWDEPNGWAPLQYLAVAGLRRYGQSDLASQIATRWVQTNVAYYQRTGKLVEKYDVDAKAGATAAGGGEYPLQDGFGWTNGVLRTLMAMYPAAVRSTRPVDVPEGPRGVSEAASSAAAAPQTTHRLQETPGK
ncbi:alpha,alpha-trehalase TreF [Paraburkholderia sp. SARCC-3016]|uniref:alpha,alpha-trehalase TreF n=1 Tax=Paraburkholderia sp. SARCC-3016 TaxID=3058611 RepID=UPI00280A1F95|nr:alpha,alpha-trehalase TreF [Paraburkholderia sp. SARCC-3016]MDQ7980519.1 alpha,alpha-trehalase TreF [Paraburkholderia sp. SARCC-3016]